MPASTVASSAILINATRMPSSMTSSIDHTWKWPTQRSISPPQNGAGERRSGKQQRQHEQQIAARGDDGAERHQHAGDLLALQPHLIGALGDGGAGRAPHDREVHQGQRIGDEKADDSRDGQRQRQISRRLRLLRQQAAAARAARLGAWGQRGHALQQVAIGTGGRFRQQPSIQQATLPFASPAAPGGRGQGQASRRQRRKH